MRAEPLVSVPTEPVLDDEVLTLDPAVPAQRLPEHFGLPSTRQSIPGREKSNACGLRRLRPGSKRRRYYCDRESVNELAPIHSIT